VSVGVSRSEYRIKSQYKSDNKFFEMMEEFKELGKIFKNPNSIQEEIKSRLKSGNVCYHSVQNISSYRLVSKNIKFKLHRTKILPVVLFGFEI